MDEMKIKNLMQAIFFIVIAIALFQITVIISGETYNVIFAICFIIGIVLFFAGLIKGVFALK